LSCGVSGAAPDAAMVAVGCKPCVDGNGPCIACLKQRGYRSRVKEELPSVVFVIDKSECRPRIIAHD